MSRIVDDDPPIKTGVTSQAYRDNWDRIFGEKGQPHESDCPVPGEPHVTCPEPLDVETHAVAPGEHAPPVLHAVAPQRCSGCDEEHCECDEHDPACAKLCTQGERCDCGRAARL